MNILELPVIGLVAGWLMKIWRSVGMRQTVHIGKDGEIYVQQELGQGDKPSVPGGNLDDNDDPIG